MHPCFRPIIPSCPAYALWGGSALPVATLLLQAPRQYLRGGGGLGPPHPKSSSATTTTWHCQSLIIGDPRPQRLKISIWFWVGEVKSLLRKPGFLCKGVKVLEAAVRAMFAPTRFSLVRISIRDLVVDRNPYQGILGLGWGSNSDPQVPAISKYNTFLQSGCEKSIVPLTAN